MNKIKILFMLFVWLSTNSCTSFLEDDSRALLNADTFYSNEQEAGQAINGIYKRFADNDVSGYATAGIVTDLTKMPQWDGAQGRSDYSFKADDELCLKLWVGHYVVIKDCNSAIDNIEANKANIDNYERYIAQARGVRAYLYFDLVRWFGDVPLVLKQTLTLNNLKIARTPQKDVFNAIIEDLGYCMQYSMAKGETSKGYNFGKMTKGAAEGFLAKVYLWLGSVTQRDNKEILGTALENFTKAMEHSKNVIGSGSYKLLKYYPDVFSSKTRELSSDEVLFGNVGLAGDGTGSMTGMMFGIQGSTDYGGSWGNQTGTDFHRMIYETSDSVRRKWNCPRVSILDNGKLYGWDYSIYFNTTGKPDDDLTGKKEIDEWRGFSIGKFRRYPIDKATYQYNNFSMNTPLLRYSDIILIYAEAYNEVNNGPGAYTPSVGADLAGTSIVSAYDAVNVVRKRARGAIHGIIHEEVVPRKYDESKMSEVNDVVPDWRPGNYGTILTDLGEVSIYAKNGYGGDYEAFKAEILNERAREFVAETTDRWCDLVRRGILVKQVQKLTGTYNPYTGKTRERSINDIGAPENVKAHHMLLPIPQAQIDINELLTKNPGY